MSRVFGSITKLHFLIVRHERKGTRRRLSKPYAALLILYGNLIRETVGVRHFQALQRITKEPHQPAGKASKKRTREFVSAPEREVVCAEDNKNHFDRWDEREKRSRACCLLVDEYSTGFV